MRWHQQCDQIDRRLQFCLDEKQGSRHHQAIVVQIEGSSYRLRQHAELMPEHVRSKAIIAAPLQPPLRRRGRPPKNGYAAQVA